MSAPTRLTIEYFADFVCPFCVIGFKSLERTLADLSGEIAADIRWRPFELNPELPLGGEDLAAHMMRKSGRAPDPQEVERIAALADRAGCDIRYRGPAPEPEPRLWNTLMAHMLVRWALIDAGEAAQTALALALFDAHFQQRRNISDRDVLIDIAKSVGLDPAGAEAALADAATGVRLRVERQNAVRRGIQGVPAIRINDEFVILGAKEPESLARMLRDVASRVG